MKTSNFKTDTSVQDWVSRFMEEASSYGNKIILKGKEDPLVISKNISALANNDGGEILVGVYDEMGTGLGAGLDGVELKTINKALQYLDGAWPKIETEMHKERHVFEVCLIRVPKSRAVTFSNGTPYTFIDGIVTSMSERLFIEKIGLGIDSKMINMFSEQIINQSNRIEDLHVELKRKSMLRHQTKGLIAGAVISFFVTMALNQAFGIS